MNSHVKLYNIYITLTSQYPERKLYGFKYNKKEITTLKNILKLHHIILISITSKSYSKNYNNLKIYESLYVKINPIPLI